MKHNGKILMLFALLAALAAATAISGQAIQPPPGTPEAQRGAGGDPIRQLNLTPEQREQIRSIREANNQERAAINQRVRDADDALNEALDSESPDEAVVERRMRDLAAAQASVMRMRILTEVRIRKVLTQEQLGTLRRLRQEARQNQRDLRREERQEQRRQAVEGGRGLQNQRNSVGPLLRPRNLRRTPRL